MKHASQVALDSLEPLLTQLRGFAIIREKSRGVFYLKSRAFLHFHEDAGGLYADVRGPREADFTRLRVDGDQNGAALLARVDAALS